MKNLKIIIALIALISIPAYAQQSANTIDQLLDRVQQGKLCDNKENQERELLEETPGHCQKIQELLVR